jgi:hypothetical protein
MYYLAPRKSVHHFKSSAGIKHTILITTETDGKRECILLALILQAKGLLAAW